MSLADPESIKLGDPVYSVGSSELIKGSIANGRVIGIGRKNYDDATNKSYVEMLKINFDIYQGDSGGPVLNQEGRLVGLLVAGSTKTGHLSLAIPSNKIKKYYLKCLEKEYSR